MGKENQITKVAITSASRYIGGATTNKQANSNKKSAASSKKGKGQHKEEIKEFFRDLEDKGSNPSKSISDHSPMKVVFVLVFSTSPKPFKYFEMWETNPSFKVTVESAWNSEVRGSPLYKLVKKLSVTKLALKQWNKDCFGLVQHKLQKTCDDLLAVQALLHQSPLDASLLSLEKSTRSIYSGSLYQEECFLR
ncbi:hypothetical protein QJS04_geneDACA002543 [Acorus gramineus]|uniref:Uncharacterized protein n=1 Tax=Acorus gramineus TaxID=55184 RepID=A0AAV9AQY7_ACOGR|nr:hypothetical protein QJS04_geneDACA002543 [Acorus gramineus]